MKKWNIAEILKESVFLWKNLSENINIIGKKKILKNVKNRQPFCWNVKKLFKF